MRNELKQPPVACSAILQRDYRTIFFYIFLFFFLNNCTLIAIKKMNIEGKSTAFRKKETIF